MRFFSHAVFFFALMVPVVSTTSYAGEFYHTCFESLSEKFTADELDAGCTCADDTLTSLDGDLSDDDISAVIVACFREVVVASEAEVPEVEVRAQDVPLDHPVFKVFFDRCMEKFRGDTSVKLTNYCECSARVFIEEAMQKNIQDMDGNAAVDVVQGSYEKRLRAECSKP